MIVYDGAECPVLLGYELIKTFNCIFSFVLLQYRYLLCKRQNQRGGILILIFLFFFLMAPKVLH